MTHKHDVGIHIIVESIMLMLMPVGATALYAALAYLVRVAVHAITGWTMSWIPAVIIAIALVLAATFWFLHVDTSTGDGSHGSR